MGHLVGAISIDILVLVAQNVRAGADAASVVGFHAVGRVEQPGRGVAACPGSATGSIICLWQPLIARGVRGPGTDPISQIGQIPNNTVFVGFSRCRRTPI